MTASSSPAGTFFGRDQSGKLVTTSQLTPPAGVPLYTCPLCGLGGLMAGSLRLHVCPAVTDDAGPHGGALPARIIQDVLDGNTATIQEPSLAERSSLLNS